MKGWNGNFGGNVINWRDLMPYQSWIKYRNYLQQTWENLAKFPAVFIRNLQWAMAQPLEDCSWVPQSVCRVRRWVWNLYARPHLRHCLRIFPHWRANDCDGKETRMKGPASGGTRTRTKGRTSHVPRHVLDAPTSSPHYFQLFYNSVILILLAFFSIFSKKRNTYVFPVFVCDITHNE